MCYVTPILVEIAEHNSLTSLHLYKSYYDYIDYTITDNFYTVIDFNIDTFVRPTDIYLCSTPLCPSPHLSL